MNLNKSGQWTVPSSSGDENYTVRRWPDAAPGEDVWNCDCIGYRIRSADQHRYACRHITLIQEQVIDEFRTALLHNTQGS